MRKRTMGTGIKSGGRSTRRTSSAVGAGLTSGRGLVVIGTFSSLPGGGVAFLGLLLPRQYCAQAAVVELGKLWSRPVSLARLTSLPVLRASIS
jgi:hypothetical protein